MEHSRPKHPPMVSTPAYRRAWRPQRVSKGRRIGIRTPWGQFTIGGAVGTQGSNGVMWSRALGAGCLTPSSRDALRIVVLSSIMWSWVPGFHTGLTGTVDPVASDGATG